MIFRIIASFSLIVLLVFWFLSARQGGFNIGEGLSSVLKGPDKEGGFWTGLRHWFFKTAVLLFIIQALSGFLPALISGDSLSGLALLIHVTAAPLMALALMGWVVLSARRRAFNTVDFSYLQHREQGGKEAGWEFRKKVYFWLGTALSVPVMLSMTLAMYPLFGMDGQQLLLEIHKYGVLLMTILFLLYLTDRSKSSKAK